MDTIIKINSVDISKDIKIMKAIVNDNAGDICDSLEVKISDIDNNWRIWDIDTSETIEVIKNGFSSGVMYIDTILIKNGICTIKATALRRKSREIRDYTLENITFLNLATTIANRLGLELKTYDVQNYSYDRVDQKNKTDMAFLVIRGILEGYRVKATDNKLVIYDEKSFENNNIIIDTFDKSMFIGEYELKKCDLDTYSKCDITYYSKELIKSTSKDNNIDAPVLKPEIRVANEIEAKRFGDNLLKYKNKYYSTIKFVTNLNVRLAGSSIIQIDGIGKYSGRYFIESISQDFINNKSKIFARKL